MPLKMTWTGALSFFNKFKALYRYGTAITTAKTQVASLVDRFNVVYEAIGEVVGNAGANASGFRFSGTPRANPFLSLDEFSEFVGMKNWTTGALDVQLEAQCVALWLVFQQLCFCCVCTQLLR